MDSTEINYMLLELLSLDHNIEIGIDCNQNIYVNYKEGYVLDGCALKGEVGRGRTIEAALKHYIRKISGKKLVFGVGEDEERQEVQVLCVSPWR